MQDLQPSLALGQVWFRPNGKVEILWQVWMMAVEILVFGGEVGGVVSAYGSAQVSVLLVVYEIRIGGVLAAFYGVRHLVEFMTARVAVLLRPSLDVVFLWWWQVVSVVGGEGEGFWWWLVCGGARVIVAVDGDFLVCGGEDDVLRRVGCGSSELGLVWVEPFEVWVRPIVVRILSFGA